MKPISYPPMHTIPMLSRAGRPVRFGAFKINIEPCQKSDILPMLEMTNDVEALVSGTRYRPEALVKVQDHIQGRIDAGKMALVVVKDQGRIIASGCLDEDKHTPTYAKISTIYVRPEYQRKGIGMRLTQHLLAEGKKRGYQKAVLSVHNPVAIELYGKLGFYPTDIDQHGDIVMETAL